MDPFLVRWLATSCPGSTTAPDVQVYEEAGERQRQADVLASLLVSGGGGGDGGPLTLTCPPLHQLSGRSTIWWSTSTGRNPASGLAPLLLTPERSTERRRRQISTRATVCHGSAMVWYGMVWSSMGRRLINRSASLLPVDQTCQHIKAAHVRLHLTQAALRSLLVISTYYEVEDQCNSCATVRLY